jgi:glycerol-3-phosphate O-acyltransferase
MQEPKFGILGTISDAVFDGKIVDAMIVPITINYEKGN